VFYIGKYNKIWDRYSPLGDIYSNIEIRRIDVSLQYKHVQNVQTAMNKYRDNLIFGICPRCGGSLQLRSGKYGNFYGCSNYPKCKFTKD
jgi:hypothetical protein